MREETAIAKSGHDPALDHQNAAFHFGFVPGLAGTGRHHADAIMHGHLLIGGIQVRLVAAGAVTAVFGLSGTISLRHAAEELEGPHVAPSQLIICSSAVASA